MPHSKWILAAAIAMVSATAAVAQSTAPAAPKPQTQAPQTEAPQAQAPPTQPPPMDKDKFSYALGMNFGENFRKQGLELDPAVFAKAFVAAFTTGTTDMSEQEMQTVLTAAVQQLRAKQAEEQAEKAEEAKQAGEAFLAANKAKEGVVTLPSGLEYKILTPGTGPKPTIDDTVVCSYRGMLIDGTEFDSSEKHGGPATLPVKGVIKGWTEALQLMTVGSKWQLVIPPDLAYGEHAPPAIGPNATLIFEVELVSIKTPADQKPTGENPAGQNPAAPAMGDPPTAPK